MTTIGTTLPNLADLAKSLDPDGKIAQVAEVLAKSSPLIKFLPMMEGNLDVGHRHTIRSGLPTATWRLLNYGVQPTKSIKTQVDDTCGMLEAVSDVDKKLADLNGNAAAFRWSEDQAHLEGMAQQAETAFFYGNQITDPEQITGVTPRYAAGDTAGDSLTSADNVINAAGTTASVNTSVWLLNAGDRKIFGIYPKGMKAGLQHIDRGEVDLYDTAGGVYRGYRSFYSWDLGLGVADWRQAVRIANINVANLISDDGTVSAGANLITSMIKAIHKLPIVGDMSGQKAFFVNRTVYLYLDLQTLKQTQMNVKYGPDQYGQEVLKFRGIPVYQSDAILNTEELVTFS